MSAQTLTLNPTGLRARRTAEPESLTTSLSRRFAPQEPNTSHLRGALVVPIRRLMNSARRAFRRAKWIDRTALVCAVALVSVFTALCHISPTEHHDSDFQRTSNFTFGSQDKLASQPPRKAHAGAVPILHSNTVRVGNDLSKNALVALRQHKRRVLSMKAKSRHAVAHSERKEFHYHTAPHKLATEVAGEPKELLKLPPTRWLHNSLLRTFVPPRHAATDMRLIVLSHACYCTERAQFLLPYPKAHTGHHFPGFMHRHMAAQSVQWKKPSDLLAFPGQKAYHVPGMTILWRGRALDSHHRHLQGSLISIRGLIDTVHKTTLGRDLKLAAESFTHGKGGAKRRVSKLYEYFFGDIPAKNRLSLRHHRPHLMCFDRVVSIGTEFEGYVKSSDSYKQIKNQIQETEKSTLSVSLVKSCKELSANLNTIWTINHGHGKGKEGSISNLADVTNAINRAQNEVKPVEVFEHKIISPPHKPCPAGSVHAGCFAIDCDLPAKGAECEKTANLLREVRIFNNMTLLIYVTGSVPTGFPYMPSGSKVIEIVPHGVQPAAVEDDIANGAHINLYRMHNKPDGQLEHSLKEQFGDVGASTRACWADSDCRAARTAAATKVDERHLQRLLQRVLTDRRKDCD